MVLLCKLASTPASRQKVYKATKRLLETRTWEVLERLLVLFAAEITADSLPERLRTPRIAARVGLEGDSVAAIGLLSLLAF